MFTQEEKAKLPQWAQHKIALLEREIASMQNDVISYADPATCSITWRHATEIAERHGLPENTTVYFRLGRREINMNVVNGELRIYGDTTIKISPRAANSIYITQE